MISPSQRPLPDNTQHSQQTNIHAPGGIRSHDCSRRAAIDLRLGPRSYWDQLFHIIWIVEFTRTNSRNMLAFPFSVSLITLTFLRCSKPFAGECSHVITLSPVKCRSRKVQGNFTHKVNYHNCRFPAWNLYSYPTMLDALTSQG